MPGLQSHGDKKSSGMTRFVGRLLNSDGAAPLAGFRVRAFDVGTGKTRKDLGHDFTSAKGLFTIVYTEPRKPRPGKPGVKAERRFVLEIRSQDGTQHHTT